jgi:hypothetical protein
MSDSFEDDETDEHGYYTFTLQDHIETVTDGVDEAVHDVEDHEIKEFCAAIEAKIANVLREIRQRQEPARPASETEERDRARWWDK